INEYVRRLRGGEYEPLHPLLKDIFGETYGILCYQEDVSKTAVALAGFNDADADMLRKILSKKDAAKRVVAYEEKFFEGCRKNGVAEEVIREVWEMILSFEGFSFCKPHSASYAMVSFQSAYLRAHHPAAFMAAVLSNGGGYYTAQAYVSEARRMGLRVLGPDVNLSRREYHARGASVVVGFMAISGLTSAAVDAILAERGARGNFASLEDFSRRVEPTREDIVALVGSGCFDSLDPRKGRGRQARLLLGRLGGGKGGALQPELFAPAASASRTARGRLDAGGATVTVRADTEDSAKRRAELLREEYERLGFLRDDHPLVLWKPDIEKLDRCLARDIPKLRARKVSLLGWRVTQKEVLTVEGRPMSFVSFEDETAIYETVFFPEAFDRYRSLLYETKPFLIRGRVEDDLGSFYVNVERMEGVVSPQGRSSGIEGR
ncbi:MAG: DNA polymerase III subunit alpha, partial [Rectinemataceae bacterium]